MTEVNSQDIVAKEVIPAMQAVVFAMCGGGFLGSMAAHQPGNFYIDRRANKLPFSKLKILKAVKVLELTAKENGMNPNKLPEMPKFVIGMI
jgi:hypothetical protein